MQFESRIRASAKVAGLHLLCSLVVAAACALVVLGLWYPYPYRELSGGRELLLLIMAVDVVCGPILTFVLFNPAKPKRELWQDLGLVAGVQLLALSYGVLTAWQARPLFLALEVDRYKVVMAADIDPKAVEALPEHLKPLKFGAVRTVALRRPKSVEEKNEVLFAAVEGGRDYAERPEFYIPYEGEAAIASWARAKPLEPFFAKYPGAKADATAISRTRQMDLAFWKLLPVVGRQDWVALVDKKGEIQGFLKGDGF